MPDVIVPYQAGNEIRNVVISEAAQEAAKAAVDYAVADASLSRALSKGGGNQLDQSSQTSRQEVLRMMRSTPPKPATILNFHPWPLTFGASNRFLRGITVPACEPGMPYAYLHVRHYRTDWEYNEDGSLKFKPILPIHMAGEFLREFSSQDGYGCGVLIYEGDGNPEKVDEVETYDPIGRAATVSRQGFEYDEENNKIPATIEVPIKKKLAALIAEQIKKRNASYLERVRKADHDYKLPDGRGKWLVNDTHLMMAQVLLQEGQIQKLPDWNLSSRFEAGLGENNCPACGAAPRAEAFKCAACGHILDPFKAYMHGAIEYGHASFELMTSDELEQIEEERQRRESVKKDVAARLKEKRAAAKTKPANSGAENEE